MRFNTGNKHQVKTDERITLGLGARESMLSNGTEFENDVKLNREPMKSLPEWDRMRKTEGTV